MNSHERSGYVLGMLLKGYPRISETFISREILALEQKGIPIEIYSLRRPREDFTHRFIREIRAPVMYVPEYVKTGWRDLFASNGRFFLRRPLRYLRLLTEALIRSVDRKTTATLRHFLQGGHIAYHKLLEREVVHVHAHFCHTPTSVALFAAYLAGLPFSFTAHAKDIYTSEPAQLRRKIRRARFVVTCTAYNKKYLSEVARGINTPIHVNYHGIDLDFFTFGHSQPDANDPEGYRILSVGRLIEKKGYDDLLRALKILKARKIPFTFIHIGDGEQRSKVLDCAGSLGLGDNVRFLGTLTQEEVLNYYRNCHCFALACKIARNGDRDGLPNVILEAMAVGIPVVSTNVSAIPEAVEDGVTGLLVPPGSPGAMAGAIERTLKNPEEAAIRAKNARLLVERKFDQKFWHEKLFHLFNTYIKFDGKA